MSDVRIVAQDICLDFHLGKPSFFDFVGKQNNTNNQRTFRAVDQMNFRIDSGDRVGLIGKNGAGKSTLLKMLSGVLRPSSGSLATSGQTFPLLDLSADIVSQATCMQNIRLAGLLKGLKGQELESYVQVVREFADIERFLFSPVSTLSTGMKTRFLISLIGEVTPEILIMDEWIGTTDSRFTDQKDSMFNRLISSAEIFILASHNRRMIRKLCNKVMIIDDGKLLFFGDVEEGYLRFNETLGIGFSGE